MTPTTTAQSRALRFIWFDQDDTLYDYTGAMHRALEPVVERMRRRWPEMRGRIDTRALARRRREILDDLDARGMDFMRARHVAFERITGEWGEVDPELCRSLAEMYYRNLRDEIRLFPRTDDCLRELSGEFVLGVISNGTSLLPDLGLEGHFEHELYTCELGLRKPHPEFFRHAMQLTGAEPGECVMVGDNPVHDVIGAREAGWRAVWLRNDRRPWPDDARAPEHVIDDIGDLPALVRALADSCHAK